MKIRPSSCVWTARLFLNRVTHSLFFSLSLSYNRYFHDFRLRSEGEPSGGNQTKSTEKKGKLIVAFRGAKGKSEHRKMLAKVRKEFDDGDWLGHDVVRGDTRPVLVFSNDGKANLDMFFNDEPDMSREQVGRRLLDPFTCANEVSFTWSKKATTSQNSSK